MDRRGEPKFEGFEKWGMYLSIALFVILVSYSLANAAEWEIVSFNDAEHLGVLQDSVVGVCNTIWADTTDGQIKYYGKDDYKIGFYTEFDGEIHGRMRSLTQTNLCDGKLETHYIPPIITCRRLVCVTVVPEPYGVIHQTTGAIVDTKQWAIIFYEEVKQ